MGQTREIYGARTEGEKRQVTVLYIFDIRIGLLLCSALKYPDKCLTLCMLPNPRGSHEHTDKAFGVPRGTCW